MSNRLNKQDFASTLVQKEMFKTKKEAIEFIEVFFESISEIIERGDSLAIPDFGKFSLYTKLDGQTKPKFTPFEGLKTRCSNEDATNTVNS